MYSFLLRPKWILFHVLVVAAIVGMLSASSWQWNKYNARDEFVSTVEVRQDRDRTPPVPLGGLLDELTNGSSSTADIEYRVATATGTYLVEDQLIQILRTQEGVNGVNVLTPFQIDDGPIVLVNRGFVPDNADPAPPPAGTVTIGGTIRVSQERRTGELTDNAAGEAIEVRRVDLPLIAERLGVSLAPVYLEFIASDPPAAEPPIPVPPPDLTGGPPYLSYTIQWLLFSICVAVGWVFAVRRSVRTRRRALAAGESGDEPGNGVVSVGGEPPAQPSA